MRHQQLGNTGIAVSALGLGGAALGNHYGDLRLADAIATVRTAFELGIDVFDTSPYYGKTLGETVLGQALRGLPRDRYVLMTKCGRYDVDGFDFAPANLRQSLDDSLRRLQTDHVDVFQLHDVEFGDLDRILDETLPALQALKQTGKVRWVGITGLPLAIFRRALARQAPLDTVLSYCHATLFDTTLLDLLPALASKGIGVVNASPAAMGLLANRGPQPWHPADAAIKDRCRQAAELCAGQGVELAELALQYACSLPGIATTLCGAASRAEVAASVAAVERPIDRDLLARVQQVLAPIRGRTWPQGRPENQT